MEANRERCDWALGSDLERDYHDHEWGVPTHDDLRLFEFLVLEGAQAGLSWHTILSKREGYRRHFAGFDPAVVARFGAEDVDRLVNLETAEIVRNRAKIEAAVSNAAVFLDIQDEFGSFDDYVWRFVDGEPMQNRWRTIDELPAQTPISEAMSRDLKQRGFRFVGPTVCYAHMQATGMVNDHLVSCFRHAEVA